MAQCYRQWITPVTNAPDDVGADTESLYVCLIAAPWAAANTPAVKIVDGVPKGFGQPWAVLAGKVVNDRWKKETLDGNSESFVRATLHYWMRQGFCRPGDWCLLLKTPMVGEKIIFATRVVGRDG